MLSKISLLRFPKNSVKKLIHEKNCVTLWDEFTKSQSTFSKSFFLVFVWEYFLCHHKLQCPLKYPIADSKKTVLANHSEKRKVLFSEMNWHIKKYFSESFLLDIIWGYFLCYHRLQCDPKYTFYDSPKTVLPNFSMNGMV